MSSNVGSLNFQSFNSWNEFLRALNSPGKVIRVAKRGLYLSDMSMARVGKETSIIRCLPAQPEAHFPDGTMIKLSGANYQSFEIAFKSYGISGVS